MLNKGYCLCYYLMTEGTPSLRILWHTFHKCIYMNAGTWCIVRVQGAKENGRAEGVTGAVLGDTKILNRRLAFGQDVW